MNRRSSFSFGFRPKRTFPNNIIFGIILLVVTPMTAVGLVASSSSFSDTEKLIVPSAGPSLEFLAKRKVSIRTIDWSGEGKMLPLQRYRATAPTTNTNTRTTRTQGERAKGSRPSDNEKLIQSIQENPTSFNLSKTSLYMLEQYSSLSEQQKKQLLQKIKAEKRATQLVSREALQIVYCDAHICVVNKPSGILSVPGPRRNPCLSQLVFDEIQPPDITLDQMVVHRLDMATSGIIVFALSLEALSKLHSDFKQRRVQKTYQALVHDNTDCLRQFEGEIDVELERDPFNPPFMRLAQPKSEQPVSPTKVGDSDKQANKFQIGSDHKFYKQAPKESFTTWTLLGKEYLSNSNGTKWSVSRLELRPWTGRTHQLRVHCAKALNAPIVGDEIYGSGEDDGFPLCLHAQRLCIYHPVSGAPMIFEVDAPF